MPPGSPRGDLPEPFILPECDFQIVLRFQSHHRQFTPCSRSQASRSAATPKGGSDTHQSSRMRLRAAYRELFRRSHSRLSVPLSLMPAANREHLWDRRVLSTRKRQGGRRCDGLHSTTFYFCPHCGSTVYWELRRKPEMVA